MFRTVMFIFSLALIFQNFPAFAAEDGLDAVNRRRASKKLRPFVRDEALSQGAAAIADYRAANLISGHLGGSRGDFAYLPAGAHADSGGCAAWAPSVLQQLHWGSCCSDEDWVYAGAAYAMGRDGKVYMHLFVSNRPNPVPSSSPVQRPIQTSSYWTKVPGGWWLVQGNTHAGYLHENRMFQWRNPDGSFSQGQYLAAGQAPVK